MKMVGNRMGDLFMYKNETSTVKKTHAYLQAKASEDCTQILPRRNESMVFFLMRQKFSIHEIWTPIHNHESKNGRGGGVGFHFNEIFN